MAILGCIADDFTGAGDLASFLKKGGMSVLLVNGAPKGAESEALAGYGCETYEASAATDAIVVALKTRSIEAGQAVKESLEALDWLMGQGCRTFYVKYCSTFDSTPRGNIGPVCDAVMERLKTRCTILAPALPVNKRTVKDGCLYVDGVPLHKSHMKDHPLNPMWDCRLSELMKPQSRYPVYGEGELPEREKELLKEEMGEAGEASGSDDRKAHFYIVPDCVTDSDCAAITERFFGLPLYTGGSGLAEPLARRLMQEAEEEEGSRIAPGTVKEDSVQEPGAAPSNSPAALENGVEGSALILAGSCSVATLEQIENYHLAGGLSFRMDPADLLSGRTTLEMFKKFIEEHLFESVLIYSCDCTENIRNMPPDVKERSSAVLEAAMSELAEFAVSCGVKRLIVAGGETSGAVTKRLDFQNFYIGDSIAPGVPVMIPVERTDIRLVLKSGNFGQPDFFLRALSLTEGEHG